MRCGFSALMIFMMLADPFGRILKPSFFSPQHSGLRAVHQACSSGFAPCPIRTDTSGCCYN
jgi:hypothetical protein